MAPALSVVVPCLDEARNIPRFDTELFAPLDSLGVAYEVIAVDDGSRDGTFQALQELSRRRPSLRVLRHAATRGIGAALKSALDKARGDWLVFLDADLTFRPAHIRALLDAQRALDADCASGSAMLGGMRGVPLARRLPSMAMNAFYRGLFGRVLSSYTAMFRLYRAEALRSLGFRCEGFEVSAEIAVLLLRRKARIVEVPVPLESRILGASKMRGLRELARHLRLIARLLCG